MVDRVQLFFIYNDIQFTFLTVTERRVLISKYICKCVYLSFQLYQLCVFVILLLGTYIFMIVMLSWLVDPFIIMKDSSLYLVIFLVLKLLLFLNFFLWFMFSWYVFFHPLNFNLPISLYWKWHLVEYCFFTVWKSLALFAMLSLLLSYICISMIGLKFTVLLFVFCLSHQFFVFFLLFSCLLLN